MAVLNEARPSIGKYSLFSPLANMRSSACGSSSLWTGRRCGTRGYLFDDIEDVGFEFFGAVGADAKVEFIWMVVASESLRDAEDRVGRRLRNRVEFRRHSHFCGTNCNEATRTSHGTRCVH